MGNIKEINIDSEQLTRFKPTKDELLALLKHWVNEAIGDEYFIFWGQCFGRSDLRRIEDDWERVNEIAGILGEDVTNSVIEEVYLQAAQEYDRNDWIVFRYGTSGDRSAYQEIGGQAFLDLDDALAGRIASRVVERVFRDGTTAQQMRLLREELRRHSNDLERMKRPRGWFIRLFDSSFPIEAKTFILNFGLNDPNPTSHGNTVFENVSLEQGKVILSAFDAEARKGTLKDLLR